MEFTPSTTLVHVKPERIVKGPRSDEVVIVVGGGLRPEPDLVHASLSIDESAPLLVPGDRGVWLLQDYPGKTSNMTYVQPFSGQYKSVDNRVEGTPGNPFRDKVDGRGEDEFLQALEE